MSPELLKCYVNNVVIDPDVATFQHVLMYAGKSERGEHEHSLLCAQRTRLRRRSVWLHYARSPEYADPAQTHRRISSARLNPPAVFSLNA